MLLKDNETSKIIRKTHNFSSQYCQSYRARRLTTKNKMTAWHGSLYVEYQVGTSRPRPPANHSRHGKLAKAPGDESPEEAARRGPAAQGAAAVANLVVASSEHAPNPCAWTSCPSPSCHAVDNPASVWKPCLCLCFLVDLLGGVRVYVCRMGGGGGAGRGANGGGGMIHRYRHIASDFGNYRSRRKR